MAMSFKPFKKYFRNGVLFILTIGASLTLGLLSFSGMFVLWPLLSLAIAAAILAIAYEGEIFWQNLKGVFKTLFSSHPLKRQVLREFLHKYASVEDPSTLPILVQDYLKLVRELDDLEHAGEHHNLSSDDKLYKKLLQEKIKRFEIETAKQLLDSVRRKDDDSKALKELQEWFDKNKGEEAKKKYIRRIALFITGGVFSIVAGACIFFGTGYLLFDTFMTIPLLASIPAAAVPGIIAALAAVSGIAYGLITYNSITSMLNNRTLQNFYRTLKNDVKENGATFGNVAKIGGAVLFLLLTITLTVCTAGTWWTIGQNLAFIVQRGWLIACTACITASTFIINLFNTICTWFGLKEQVEESLKSMPKKAEEKTAADAAVKEEANEGKLEKKAEEQVENKKASKPSSWQKLKFLFKSGWAGYRASWAPINPNDSALQKYNPFRFLIKVLFTPIDWCLFVAHVVSIGVAGDQIPGIPQGASATLCAVDEFKEDWHRFFGHSHHHGPRTNAELLKARSETGGGHEHGLDLPRRFIQILFTPLYLFAILIDFIGMMASKAHPDKSAWQCFKAACVRQYTGQDPKTPLEEDYCDKASSPRQSLSLASRQFDADILIRPLEKRLQSAGTIKPEIAKEKTEALDTLRKEINEAQDEVALGKILNDAPDEPVFSKRRNHFFKDEAYETHTTGALRKLGHQVNLNPVQQAMNG